MAVLLWSWYQIVLHRRVSRGILPLFCITRKWLTTTLQFCNVNFKQQITTQPIYANMTHGLMEIMEFTFYCPGQSSPTSIHSNRHPSENIQRFQFHRKITDAFQSSFTQKIYKDFICWPCFLCLLSAADNSCVLICGLWARSKCKVHSLVAFVIGWRFEYAKLHFLVSIIMQFLNHQAPQAP